MGFGVYGLGFSNYLGIGYIGVIGIIGTILGLYRKDGKENGNYYLGFRVQGLGFMA